MKHEGPGSWTQKERESETARMMRLRQKNPGEPEVCRAFGCGIHLTLQERLHGNYCIHHQEGNIKEIRI